MNVYEQTLGCKNSPIFNNDISRKTFKIASGEHPRVCVNLQTDVR